MTISTMHSVVLELKRRDIPASFESPEAVICVSVGTGALVIAFDDFEETLEGNVYDENDKVVETLKSSIPSDCDDVTRITNWIACCCTEERQ